MDTSSIPYQQLLFVCTNSRADGERVSCAGKGRCGQQVLERLKAYVSEHHLEETVRVAKSGCHEKCEQGPNIAVMPQNIFLSGVTLDDVSSIIKTYLTPYVIARSPRRSNLMRMPRPAFGEPRDDT